MRQNAGLHNIIDQRHNTANERLDYGYIKTSCNTLRPSHLAVIN